MYGRESAHKRGYDGDWNIVRRFHLDMFPNCKYCAEQGKLVRADVVDHIEPIHLAPERRLDLSNLQSLCKVHHDSTKQREEKSGKRIGCDQDGMPIDPTHPWNT